MIAALFVEADGVYSNLSGVVPFDNKDGFDARLYQGPHPDSHFGFSCYVEQGHYGHMSRKPTWLYCVGTTLPVLAWTACEQRLHPTALARHGYAKARRIGMKAMVGGKDKTAIRNRTPEAFRDILLAMARSVERRAVA